MRNFKLSYFQLILLHAAIALAIFILPFLSKIYALAILILGFSYVLKTKNRSNQALYVAAYFVGSEVFLRMTNGNFFDQYSKVGVMSILLLGMLFSGFSKNAVAYILFILLLMPGVAVAIVSLDADTNMRTAITFNIIGPLCLGISAIYAYRRRISLKNLRDILEVLSFPIVTTVVYLFLYSPSVKAVITGTDSSFETSGGFGPNQVSTILGLGIFVFFVKLVFEAKTRMHFLIDLFFMGLITYRGIVTFSRGGIITGIIMVVIISLVLFVNVKARARSNLVLFIGAAFLVLIVIWGYSSRQTNGLINKRYANEDARGREKVSKLSGREFLITTEIQMFLDHPFLGIGVGKNKEYREKLTGIESASHNELTRMLAEHGALGILALLILIFTPLILYVDNKQNIFVLALLAFWFLTINHAAMRIAAPAFIYSLSLLKVQLYEVKPTLHRKQTAPGGANP